MIFLFFSVFPFQNLFSFFRAISGREIAIPKSVRVLHVEQEAHGDDTRALDCVLGADVERTELVEQVRGEKERLLLFRFFF